LESELSEDQKESLISVKECADLLLHIINSVLDLAKIEAGRLEVESVPFNIGKLVSSTLRMLQARAQERGLQLLWEVDIGVPQVLVGDVGKIQQCLLNLGESGLVLFSPPPTFTSSLSLSLSHRKAVIILSMDFHCFQKCRRNSGHRMLL
jgi:K+-sensing histidine kinase KdpD